MDIIVLAGGKGTRLQSVVSDRPKPMADINGKPFLYYLLEHVVSFSIIDTIVLSVGYKKELIKGYFGDRFLDVPILNLKKRLIKSLVILMRAYIFYKKTS